MDLPAELPYAFQSTRVSRSRSVGPAILVWSIWLSAKTSTFSSNSSSRSRREHAA